MAFPGRGSSSQGGGRSRAANRHLGRRKVRDALFYGLFLGSIVLGIGALAVLLIDILTDGLPWLTFDFITTYPSRHAEESGIKAALYGSLWSSASPASSRFRWVLRQPSTSRSSPRRTGAQR